MCSKFLSLADTCSKVPNRKFGNNTYWNTLSKITKNIGNDSMELNDPANLETLSKTTASIFDRNKK